MVKIEIYWHHEKKRWEYENGSPIPYEEFFGIVAGDTFKALGELMGTRKEKKEGMWNKFLNLFR